MNAILALIDESRSQFVQDSRDSQCYFFPGRSLVEGSVRAGVLSAIDECPPRAKGSRIPLPDSEFIVTDGPFTETKELAAGFAPIRAKSKGSARVVSQRLLESAGDGEIASCGTVGARYATARRA